MAVAFLSSCKKDGNPNNLPRVSRADYAGKNLPTSAQEIVKVLLEEEGERDRVIIAEPI